MPSGKRVVVTVLAAAALVGACGSPDEPGGRPPAEGSDPTVPGVTGTAVTLGVIGDRTGPLTAGNQLWADDVNTLGGVCGRRVELAVVDPRGDPDAARTLYPQLAPEVLGLVQLDPRVLAAVGPQLAGDGMLAVQGGYPGTGPGVLATGAGPDTELINGLHYLREEGLIDDGDQIGHIVADDARGDAARPGVRYYAGQHDLTVREVRVGAGDGDLADAVDDLYRAGASAIVLSTGPAPTASVLTAVRDLDPDLPVLGGSTTFDPALLDGPAAAALDRLYVAMSGPAFTSPTPRARQIAVGYEQKYPGAPLSPEVFTGYRQGMVWQAVLAQACTDGELTRPAVAAAPAGMPPVETDGLSTTLSYADPGAAPTRGAYVVRGDPTAEGGLTEVAPASTAPDADGYAAVDEPDRG